MLVKVEEISNAQVQPPGTATASKNSRSPEIWFAMTDVPNFVGRVEDLVTLHELVTEDRDEDDSSIALLVSLLGFGGIGKTALARKQAWKYRKYFDGNVIWINAETFGSMRSAFQKVAEKLNLQIDKTNHDLNDLTELVYNAFAYSKCLFIFDNAENFDGHDGIEQFLPSGIIQKPYLLLTSRRKDCFPAGREFPFDVLSQEDSIKLIKLHMPCAPDEIAEKLASKLEHVPLEIHQAIAYIKKSTPAYSLKTERDASYT